jgi:hypothetical protein
MAKRPAGSVAIALSIPIILLLCVTMSGCSTAQPATAQVPSEKIVLYSNDLSQLRDDWGPEFDGDEGKIFYSGGSLHIRDNQPPEWTICYVFDRKFSDFILDVDTTLMDGSASMCQGVLVGMQDEYNYYSLNVCDGYYTIQKRERGSLIIGRFVNLVPPAQSEFIRTDFGELNHIQIEMNKGTIQFSVNGHHLDTVTDTTFKEGMIGFQVADHTPESYTEVVFSNLTVTTP